VDCVVNGGKSNPVSVLFTFSKVHTDLCTENGVDGYPQMNLYHDGVRQATFQGARSYERIINFIKEHTGVSEPYQSAPDPELSDHEPKTPEVERNPQGEVLVLTPETFPNVIADGDVFVKFFAPWWVIIPRRFYCR